MRYLGINKTPEDHDRTFLNSFNLIKMEALKLWFKPEAEVNHTDMGLRLQEIAFNNAAFLARLEA